MKSLYLAGAIVLLAWAGAAAAEEPAALPRKNDPKAVRCVRMPVTGSLAQVRKVCKTNDEWNRAREDAQRVNMLVCAGSRCAGQ